LGQIPDRGILWHQGRRRHGDREQRLLSAKSAYDPSSDPDDPAGTYQDTSLQRSKNADWSFSRVTRPVEEQARALVKAGNAPAGMDA